MSMLRWPRRAAMASRLMPRLIAWVARVCLSWWGWMCGRAGGGAGPVDHPGDGVAVQRAAVLARQQQWVPGGDVLGTVAVDEGDQLGMQGQVAVFAELADGDVQPGPGADEDHSAGLEAGELADPQPGAQQHLDGDPDQHPAVVVGGAQQPGRGGD